LSGLLIDRAEVKVAVVDVRAALEEAKARVRNWNGPLSLPGAAYVDPLSE